MIGLNNMSYLPRLLFLVMSIFSTMSFAGSGKHEEVEISMEFLEFLSEWETDQGEWSGPDGFIDDSFDQFFVIEQEDIKDETDK
jgi:hypothetical protein